jgi:hypothetical protein
MTRGSIPERPGERLVPFDGEQFSALPRTDSGVNDVFVSSWLGYYSQNFRNLHIGLGTNYDP